MAKLVILQDCARDVSLVIDLLYEYGAVVDLEANGLTLQNHALPPEVPERRHSR